MVSERAKTGDGWNGEGERCGNRRGPSQERELATTCPTKSYTATLGVGEDLRIP
jgi:hypothetical protein